MGRRLRNITKNLHVGEISEGESDMRLLKRNNTKNSHTGEIGEGEIDVRLLKREEWVYRTTVYSTTGTTWSGSPLWRETAAMTALVYSILHTRIYREYVHVYWPCVRRYTPRLTKRLSTVKSFSSRLSFALVWLSSLAAQSCFPALTLSRFPVRVAL